MRDLPNTLDPATFQRLRYFYFFETFAGLAVERTSILYRPDKEGKSFNDLIVWPCVYDFAKPKTRTRQQEWIVPGSKPNPTKPAPCMWTWCTLNLNSRAKYPPAAEIRKLEEGSGDVFGL
ncbi:hypothetical protein AVEN_208057-1 [Araneus ventricosus]|uniref:Uncharacterized protein n=1 Tax=Araneus ventricosus TaxID=182803 RepID=A0A4Y2WP48_ARAVE|nr:hypothetical protein AVEN_208057-1 [Araneus ventricosus]